MLVGLATATLLSQNGQLPIETYEEQCSQLELAGRVLQVTCGLNRAEFHAHKYDRQISGETCLFESKLVSLKHIRNAPCREVRKSIKYKVETIRDWLAKSGILS